MRIQTRFAREVRKRRQARGMTLDQLAEEAELSPNYLGSIESGKRDPSLSTVQRLADAFGVSIGELVGDRDAFTADVREAAKLFADAPRSVRASVITLLRSAGASR
jgi:transcriptional regulator with XRE-family HTH domain